MINVCIIHYNTPKLTEALIRSVNKHVHDCQIYVFDNSDKLPFINIFDNVKVFDNTQGKIINFNKWLEKYPNRKLSPGKINGWGSAKHCYSVEKCMDLIGDNFVLLDSDTLIIKDFSDIVDEKYAYSGEIIIQPKSTIKRVLPFICYINVKMCKRHNIHYFDEKYMHGLKFRSKSDLYDTGAGFYINAKQYPHKNLMCKDYVVHFKGGSWQSVHQKRYGTTVTPANWLYLNKNYWSDDDMKNKKVIYTCITGGYDTLKPVSYVMPDFDYVCFTDNMSLTSPLWKILPIPEELSGLSNVKKQRCIKINPHKYLSEYDLSVWIDGSVVVKGDINKLIKNDCSTDAVVFIPQHPQRNCIYTEADVCVRMKKDTADNISPQIERYKKEGFPKNFGLVQSNIIIRKHNDTSCINLMNTWWTELKNGSHRDQLSFNYAVWKNPSTKIKLLSKTLYKSEYFLWEKGHPKPSKNIPPKKSSTNILSNMEATTYSQPPVIKKENNKITIEKAEEGTSNVLLGDMTKIGSPITPLKTMKKQVMKANRREKANELRLFLGSL